MLTQEVCDHFEIEITKALRASEDERLNGYWCDGVLLPSTENEYSKKAVNDTRRL
jgi:hypothetical protein